MVHFRPSHSYSKLVLYSAAQRCWKLADFGPAVAGSSKHLITTGMRRGTESYRAPEVLVHNKYNNRTDMFAFGCIVFELLVGKQLFDSDWATLDYAQHERTIPWPPYQDSRLRDLGILTSDLLARDPSKRIGAMETQRRLLALDTKSETLPRKAEVKSDETLMDDFFELDPTGRSFQIVDPVLSQPEQESSVGKSMSYPYITGADPSVAHVKLLGTGGFGEVHKVLGPFINIDNVSSRN